jgi:hypothetical protein
MLYKLEVADLNLEQVRSLDCLVTMAVWHRPFFPKRGKLVEGHRHPMFGAMVRMASLK